MLTNDTSSDIITLIKQEGTSVSRIAEKNGMAQGNMSRFIHNAQHVDRRYISIIESIGYDVRIEYVKRN